MVNKKALLIALVALAGLGFFVFGDSEASTSSGSSKPLICVLVPTTSRHSSAKTFRQSTVYKRPLSTFTQVLELDKYDYALYLGFDTIDKFFMQSKIQREAMEWAKKVMPTVHFLVKPFENVIKRPGPIMNFLSQEAFNDGCDYFYRINDDTMFLTEKARDKLKDGKRIHQRLQPKKWASLYIAELKKMKPPFIGAVGPWVKGPTDNYAILTHDFTSRNHLKIFGIHYPKVFPDWYLDNWITFVYGENKLSRPSSFSCSSLVLLIILLALESWTL